MVFYKKITPKNGKFLTLGIPQKCWSSKNNFVREIKSWKFHWLLKEIKCDSKNFFETFGLFIDV